MWSRGEEGDGCSTAWCLLTEDVHKASMTKCNAEKGVAEWKWRGVDRRKRSRSHEIKNDET